MIDLKEDGYEIIAEDTDSMVAICTELCKQGFHFKAYYDRQDWHIYLTGAF